MAGLLDKAVGYLSGPMEYVADHGIEWRRKFVRLSKEAGLGIDFIDPTDKPGGIEIKIGENKEHQATLKREGRFLELQQYVKQYRRYDLRFVDYADFLVTVINPTIAQWGTSNEVYVAESQHKPNFFICDGGLHNLPNWLFSVIDYEVEGKVVSNVFDSVEAVIERLTQLDNGDWPLSSEWVLVRKSIEDRRALEARTRT